MTGRFARIAVSVPMAVLLSAVIAGSALGFSWSGRIAITSSGSGFGDGIAAQDANRAVISYVEWNGNGYDVKVTRTTDTGFTWVAPLTLSTDGYDSDVAASGNKVDVVWSQDGLVRYARSEDGGLTFGPPTALSATGFAINLSVARGPGGVGAAGLVIVAWQNGRTNAIKVRTSTDGGATWNPTTRFDSHIQDMGTDVASYNGNFYLAYKTRYYILKFRRSTDGGATWSSATTITGNAYGVADQFSIAAGGSYVYVAYADKNPSHPAWGTIRYRRSIDSGASFGNERQLAPKKWKTDFPEIDWRDGVLRAVFERRTSSGLEVDYRESGDGLTWSAVDVVDSDAHDPAVAYAGHIIVMFEVGTGDAYVRLGS